MQPRKTTQRVCFNFFFLSFLVSIFPLAFPNFSLQFSDLLSTNDQFFFLFLESHRTETSTLNRTEFFFASFLSSFKGNQFFFVGKFKEIFFPQSDQTSCNEDWSYTPRFRLLKFSHHQKIQLFFVSEIRTLIPIADWRLIQMAVGTRLNASSLRKVESLLGFPFSCTRFQFRRRSGRSGERESAREGKPVALRCSALT